jgi:sugar/nucleoside kinase (ribokinase family)
VRFGNHRPFYGGEDVKKGLFIGLATLDCLYLVEQFPQQNQKIVALDHCISAGGPAANAAIAFQAFGHQATWLGILGNHPISQLIKADLSQFNLNILDLSPDSLLSPPVSSITITQGSGDRNVISLNAMKVQATSDQLPSNLLDDIDIILIDGHQMEISSVIAKEAQQRKIPVVIDGGSWKTGLETVLPYADYIISSANFYPPHCDNLKSVLSYLNKFETKGVAVTNGEKPIIYRSKRAMGELKAHSNSVIDTLGAGDIFHGVFCHFILNNDFVFSLKKASEIASLSCKFFGTREWLKWI